MPGIFISRLVPGGLAESTGLVAVNDEVLEVNGIEVTGKSLDQVTDMMVANSTNLIITVKPVNQNNTLATQHSARHHPNRRSGVSVGSNQSALSIDSDEVKDMMLKDDDDDEVRDHTAEAAAKDTSASRVSESDSAVVTL